jgi:formylglycine-generating enzyme required for sulfatase activity
MKNKIMVQIAHRFEFIALIAVIAFTTAVCSKVSAQSAPGSRSTAPEIPGMVWIPAGTFTMGSPESEPGRFDNETQHQVRLTKGFYLGKYPVTQAQYQAVMKMNPSYYTGSSGGDNPANRPVEQVSWYDAIVFCNRLSMEEGLSPAYRIKGSTNPSVWGNVPKSDNTTWNAVELIADSNGYRLPTEAQWEYACRAGTTTAFNWGTNTISSSVANYDASVIDANNTAKGTGIQRITEVGSYAPNAWGLYDMHGNVCEWCWDWYGDYSSGTQTDPTGAVPGHSRVFRGGSWALDGRMLRSACRGLVQPYFGFNIGVRLSRPL